MPGMSKLLAEYRLFQRNKYDHIFAELMEHNIFHWCGKILGPSDTPLEGGIFILDLFFNKDYSSTPPTCVMRTKMFHPNISSTGDVGIALFNLDWNPIVSVEMILLSISSILDTPLMDYPFNQKAAQCLRTDPHNYDCIVREYTRQYAKESSLNAEERELDAINSHVCENKWLWVSIILLLFGIVLGTVSVGSSGH